ncbi:tRNA (adenosine(37)-N6)-threonylcarbamoyltransferase complex dimerization subunit type 1 TsaB [Rhizobium tubonense]|uniref:tRNA (Adenosine(37)-N6)-threonylcarbamoyltransferase complex dimerization subunit type 1 TsaB n=1 Tax=Rhizobium tubonense TaxID=484088 RepID=A0A2W4CG89_9HYPH|nr:tRNA (adenosine(37)-N6)-threonylcarbamoyltransferase complex dimerization subunit type 1 TsaB [Rhizobium tubonense]PZM12157.1 tRNA (adenosine(37)-N6)-threonylcarbamoyltransferase complex dimerization subunit type 1 TsaB [Rhizobium tubonense]
MIVLALDTAGVDCAAAVYDSGTDSVLGEVTETIGRGHAELLMAIIDRALVKAGVALQSVDRIAVSIGPGSFTGIRVGVAAARGFALSLGIPAVGVTTLQVLAAAHHQANPGRPLLVAMDAKRGEVYLQRFDERGHAAGEPVAVTVEKAQAIASGFKGDIVGSGASLLTGQSTENSGDRFPIAVIAKLGALAGIGEKPKPLYLRGPDVRPQAGFAVALK